ncbi:MAG: amino acid adenylation domain-containing protein, partial [Candidatus Magasanikbacteria bacterium]|nr:amino acid adenylation domain-containing protein [Candidatus Magasanikbacteria bacterium]
IEEYCYTDLSKAFLHHAEDKYARPFLKTKLLDAGLAPGEQGFETGVYDFVIAANVLHATPNIRTTVRNAQALLKVNGLLVLNELSAQSFYTHLTFGLLDGWWLYEDPALRLDGSPGLAPESWSRILRQEGFNAVWLPAQAAQKLGQQIIIAQNNGAARQANKTTAIEPAAIEKNSEVQVASVAAGPDAGADDLIWETLKEIISQSLDVPLERIEADRSFSEYGVDSIVAVQLVNEINHRLGLLLQTTVLFDFNTLNDLTQHIEESHSANIPKQQAAAPLPRSSGATYRRALITGPGSIEDLEIGEGQETALEPYQVRVRVEAASLNFSDLLCVKGLYPNMPPYPFTPGSEAAGEVIEIGSAVTAVSVGQDVVCLAQGCHAAVVTCAEENVQAKPPSLSFEEACALPTVALTMLDAFDKADMEQGESILIQTAAGGTGLIAVQLAQHLGAKIYATAGSAEKLEYLRSLGVENVINYQETDFEDEIKRLTAGRGVDVIINTLPDDAMQKGLNCLAPGGRYIEIAMAALKSARAVDLSVLNSNQSFFSIDLARLIAERPRKIKAYRKTLDEFVETGVLRPILSKIAPFSEIQDAYRHLENRSNIGKVVLSMRAVAEHAIPPSPLSQPVQAAANDDIAVIGMAGRFAQSETVEAFWQHLAAGTNLVDEVSRWDLGPTTEGQCRHGSFLDGIDGFDPLFFRMSGLEATYMDPQQRLFLEEAWHALEDAGYAGDGARGSSCGVYVGCAAGDYHYLFGEAPPPQAFWGNSGSVIPARIAYHLDLQGPAVAVDTACSSSLVALHMACQGLRTREIEMAIAGGVFLQATPGFYASANPAGMLSPTGQCHTFDKNADGFVPGEGVGAVILKRLSAALADGDHIHGVIKGSALNQDGHSNGITAPSARSQERLERQVYDRFDIHPESLQMIEAHGTGTKLGDPIEVEALTRAFRHYTDEQEFCALGSVKTNIGHLAAAAGIAGVIKILLSMKHSQIPPSLNFSEGNPAIPFAGGPFKVNTTLKAWRAKTKRAAVSSFGFSGTNAHMVFEEAPKDFLKPSPPRSRHLVVVSARTAEQLRTVTQNLSAHCRSGADLGHLAFTLLMGRDHQAHRLAFIVSNLSELEDKLNHWLSGAAVADQWQGEVDNGGIRQQAALRSQGNDAINASDLESVAALYVQGYRLDYVKLFGPGFRRVPLPLYPFSKERYWVEHEARPLTQPQPTTQAAPSQTETHEKTVTLIKELVAETLRVPSAEINTAEPLESYGVDSILVVQLTDNLRRHFDGVSSTLLFEVQTIDGLVESLLEKELKSVPAEVRKVEYKATDIAIIGMAGRYPQAPDLDTFWKNLKDGRNCITEIPKSRWDWQAFYDAEKGTPGKSYTKWGGFIDDIDKFDPRFFRISPAEAEYIDPQERLFLQSAWNAIEDAGHTPESLSDNKRTGVFVGVMNSLYLPQANHWSIPNRVSYLFNFNGPSLSVDTACSSSLTAIHLAMEGLQSGTCETAIAGGVNLILHPLHMTNLTSIGMLSEGPQCRSFGEGADGFVDGEGVGALVLKPLAKAVADGDPIQGVLKGSMINAGGKTNGYTVPNPLAQGRLVTEALEKADIDPATIDYIEAHGTGTALGDPIEISGLARAFGDSNSDCAVGSVKSNIGHLESAAGIAGVTKVLLQMRHEQIAPSLHSKAINPKLDIDGTPFTVQQELSGWPRPADRPRRAGISSFGAGGANAHLVIEDYQDPQITGRPELTGEAIIILTAMDADRLRVSAERLRHHLENNPNLNLFSIAWTLQIGRKEMPERLAFRASTLSEVIHHLAEFESSTISEHIVRGRAEENVNVKTASLASLLEDWVHGAKVDWQELYAGVLPHRVNLPGYPFKGERYWVSEEIRYGGLLAKSPKADLLYAHPVWKDAAAIASSVLNTEGMIFWLGAQPDRTNGVLLASDEVDMGKACCDIFSQLFLQIKAVMDTKPETPVLVQVAVPSDQPQLAGVSGLLRSAVLEYRNLFAQVVVLEGAEGPALLNARLQENAHHHLDAEVRYHDGIRQCKSLEEISLDEVSAPWKDNGVYLLAGGAGGIGIAMAKEIAAKSENAIVVLTGRSELDGVRAAHLAEIEALGAKAVYAQLDVADQTGVKNLVSAVVQDYGRLDGVLHIAGILRDSLVANKSRADFKAVLAPKILGAVNLSSATRGMELDIFALFSSGSGLYGNVGQADYAAANAFLDNFAGTQARKMVSVNWPLWDAGGMSIEAHSRQALIETTGLAPLSISNGFDAFYRVLASGFSQVMVANGDLEKLRKTLIDPFNQTSPALPITLKSKKNIEQIVLETVADLLKVAPGEIEPLCELAEYGVDSIFITRLSNELSKRYDLNLRPSDFLVCNTINSIAEQLSETSVAEPEFQPVETDPIIAPGITRFPLSEGQLGLWLLQLSEPNSSVYNVPVAFETEQDFDVEAFKRACRTIWEGVPALRTVFGTEDGIPFQTIDTTNELPVYLEDQSLVSNGVDIQRVQMASRTPFDLSGPLMRLHLFPSASGQTVVLICLHHIITDGLSTTSLLEQLQHAYQAYRDGRKFDLQLSETSYRDFVSWEQDMVSGEEGAAHLAYWQATLKGKLPVFSLPFDKPKPSACEDGDQTLHIDLCPQLAAQIRPAAQRMKVSPTVLFLTTFKILLAKLSGQEDIIVGLPTMGRRQKRFEDVVGYFVNIIALRTSIELEQSFAELATKLRATLLRSQDHDTYPFPALVRALSVKRGVGHTPIFQVGYGHLVARDFEDSLSWKQIGEVCQEGNTDLGLETVEIGERLSLRLSYRADLLERRDAERMLEQYLRLLSACLGNPDVLVSELSLLGRRERKLLLQRGNVSPLMKTEAVPVTKAFAAQAKRTPNATALILAEDPSRKLSYEQLAERSDAVAATLRGCGVNSGDKVGMCMNRSFSMVVGLLGILKSGAVYVPLDPEHPEQRLEFIISECQMQAILVEDATYKNIPFDARSLLINFDQKSESIKRRPGRRPEAKPDHGAYIIYTSGSTGRPKGVKVSHGSLADHCRTIAHQYGLKANDRVLQFAAMSVDTSIEQILPGLLSGASLVLRGDRLWTVNEFDRIVSTTKTTVADLPPTYLHEILMAWERANFKLHKTLRLMIVGGEAITPETVRLYQASPLRQTRLINAYGPTETTVTSLTCDISLEGWIPATSENVPIGRPLAGTKAYVLDAHQQPVPEGVEGELFLGGKRVADGYLDRDELTARHFIPDPFNGEGCLYATGDKVRLIPGQNGLVEFIGRKDHQVKIRGFRVELGEVEIELGALSGVVQAAIVAMSSVGGSHELEGFIVRADKAPGTDELLESLRQRLPAQMVPQRLHELDTLPLTAGGKVDRAALSLLVPHAGQAQIPQEVSADPDIADRLASIWCEMLSIPEVGEEDDFFELGGHSILAIRLLSRIHSEFGRDLPVATLLSSSSFKAQVEILSTCEDPPPNLIVDLNSGKGSLPPLFLFHAIGGGAHIYNMLARHLNPRMPVFGMQSPGLCGADEPQNVEELAALHIAAMRTQQPNGPYKLAGWSFGGILAYEVAQQLTAAGESVAALELIDSYTPAAVLALEQKLNESLRFDVETTRILAFANSLHNGNSELLAELEQMAGTKPAQALLAHLNATLFDDSAHLKRLFEIFKTHLAAMNSYVPKSYMGGSVTLISADHAFGKGLNAAPGHGWNSIIPAAKLTRRAIMIASHYNILAEPNVRDLATILGDDLDRVQAREAAKT